MAASSFSAKSLGKNRAVGVAGFLAVEAGVLIGEQPAPSFRLLMGGVLVPNM
jgi:hypothetical protein